MCCPLIGHCPLRPASYTCTDSQRLDTRCAHYNQTYSLF